MLRLFSLIVLMLGKETGITEAHVYCQDAHATDWTPLGYSCPVNCASVIEAVKTLKELEYEDWFVLNRVPFSPKQIYNISELKQEQVDNTADKSFETHKSEVPMDDDYTFKKAHRILDVDEDEEGDPSQLRNEVLPRKLTPSHFIELYKILMNSQSGSEVQMVFKLASNRLKGSCRRSKNRSDFDCFRRSTLHDDAVKEFTAVLNKYTADNYFTYDMGKTLLTKYLGSSTNLQLGKFDVNRIVKRLSGIISDQKDNARVSPRHMVLKSKFCLNVYIPGCFCIPGFVENNGQCVRPTDCFPDPNAVSQYLSRITVQ